MSSNGTTRPSVWLIPLVMAGLAILVLASHADANHGPLDPTPTTEIEVGPVEQDVVFHSNITNPKGTRQIDAFTVNQIVYSVEPLPSGARLKFDLQESRQASASQSWTMLLADGDPDDGSVLRFVADSDAGLPNDSETQVEFRIVFDVIGTPSIGKEFFINVTGYEGDPDAGARESHGQSDRKPHPVVIITDGPPEIRSATTRDRNDDGRIDAYVIEFDEPVREETIRADVFRFGGAAGVTWTPWDVASNAPTTVAAKGPVEAIIVDFPALSAVDTSATPQVTVVSQAEGLGAIFDFDEQFLKDLGAADLAETDGVAPFLEDVATVGGSDGTIHQLDLKFSEPVDTSALTIDHFTIEPVQANAHLIDADANDNLVQIGFPGTGDSATRPSVRYIGNGVIDDGASGNAMATMTAGRIARDAAAPRLLSATTLDLQPADSPDGRIDAYRLEFSEAVDDDTLRVGNWAAGTYSIDAIDTGGDIGSGPDDSVVVLRLVEDDYDSGERPPLVFDDDAGPFNDTAGNSMQDVSVIETRRHDGAAPVFRLVVSDAGDLRLRAIFSEPVTGVTDDAFVYHDSNGLGATAINAVTYYPSNRTAVILLDAALVEDDIGTDGVSAAALLVKDAADNLADPSQRVDIRADRPFLAAVTGNVGSEIIQIRFTEAVEGSTGLPLAAGDLHWDGRGGGSFQMLSVVAGNRPDTFVGTLSRPLEAAHLDQDGAPALLKVAPDKVRRVGSPLVYVPVVEKAFKDIEAPQIVSALTADLDGDGLVDRIRLEFSEPLTAADQATQRDPADWVIKTKSIEGGTSPAAVLAGETDRELILDLGSDTTPGDERPTVSFRGTAIADLAIPANLMDTFTDVAARDGVIPVSQIQLTPALPNAAGWYKSKVQVQLTSTESSATIRYGQSNNFTNLGEKAYEQPFTVLLEGDVTIEYHAIDQAGNEEAKTSTSFKVDTLQPEQLAAPPNVRATANGIVIVWDSVSDIAPGSGVSHYIVRTQNGVLGRTLGPEDRTYTHKPAVNQTFQFIVQAVDVAGNVAKESESSNPVRWVVLGGSDGGAVIGEPADGGGGADPGLALTQGQIVEANVRLTNSLHVSRQGATNIIEWDALDTMSLPAEPLGVQVWRSDGGGIFLCVKTLSKGTDEYNNLEFNDDSATAGADSLYIMTAFYGLATNLGFSVDGGSNTSDCSGSAAHQPSNVPGFTNLVEDTSGGVAVGEGAVIGNEYPWWVWPLLALLVLSIIAVAAWMALRWYRYGRAEAIDLDEGDEFDGYAWDDGPVDDVPMGDEVVTGGVTAATTETITGASIPASDAGEFGNAQCPACDHQFELEGPRPIKATCPNCGRAGILQ